MKEVVTFGEIMMRLSPPNNLRFSQTNTFEIVFGGGESNVAVSLANFGIPVSFVSQIPKNDIGDYAIMELKKRNVRTDNILRKGNRLGVKISSDYSDLTFEKETSQVIVEHGTSPVDDLYFELKDQSKNLGQVDYKLLIKGLNKEIIKNKKGDFFLFRVGDAISSRNIHAAIYDSLRICKDF